MINSDFNSPPTCCAAASLGYAIAEEVNQVGVRAVAAPIVDPAGIVIAAVSAAGLATQPAWSQSAVVVELVTQTARDISKRVK